MIFANQFIPILVTRKPIKKEAIMFGKKKELAPLEIEIAEVEQEMAAEKDKSSKKYEQLLSVRNALIQSRKHPRVTIENVISIVGLVVTAVGVAVQAWEGIKLAKISYDGDKEFKPKNGPTWNLIGKKLVG